MGGVLALVVVAVIVVIAISIAANRRRVTALRAWADAHGWTYVGRDNSLINAYQGVPFTEGHSQSVEDVLVGRWQGRPAVSFTFAWVTDHGTDANGNQNTTTHEAHVVALTLPGALPFLDLSREGFGAKVAKLFGGQDIQFESEEFNREWRVMSHDEKFAFDVLVPRTMEWLMQPTVAGNNLRIDRDAILTWREGRTNVNDIGVRLALLSGLVSRIPDFVWQDRIGMVPMPVDETPDWGTAPSGRPPGEGRPGAGGPGASWPGGGWLGGGAVAGGLVAGGFGTGAMLGGTPDYGTVLGPHSTPGGHPDPGCDPTPDPASQGGPPECGPPDSGSSGGWFSGWFSGGGSDSGSDSGGWSGGDSGGGDFGGGGSD